MTQTNRNGIEVKVICASCEHYNPFAYKRVCMKHGCGALRTGHCSDWEISEGMDNAGCSGGRVKRKAYLDFLVETRDRLMKVNKSMIPLEKARKLFEEKYGPIYHQETINKYKNI